MPQIDEITAKYLERSIRELNALNHDIAACTACGRGEHLPVCGSGHPQADIMIVKYAAQKPEIEEGVAFYGRSGVALIRAFKRLKIDPLTVYGTLCVKCPGSENREVPNACMAKLREEFAIVMPRILVVMGELALNYINTLAMPLSAQLEPHNGCAQQFTPVVDALYTPDIDTALDSESGKREFWDALRPLGALATTLPCDLSVHPTL